MPTLVRISVTPLKSTALHHLERVVLGPGGVAENRRFFMIDAVGRLLAATRHPGVFGIEATYDAAAERLALAFSGGARVEGSAVATGAAVTVDFWGRPTAGRLVEGEIVAARAAFVGEPVRLVRATTDGGGCDDHPVTLVSSASIRELARQAGRDAVDARRFRMLLEVDGTSPHEEDAWEGRLLRIGGAVLRLGGPVPRCDVTQRDPDTGRRDLETLRTIGAYRGRSGARTLDFGVYGVVAEPGPVAVGDAAILLDG
jgi:MOSC domain-containing protein